MFNTTHTLAGLAVARLGLDHRAPYALWTAAIAANLPDIDIVYAFDSTAAYLEHHRGITHALVSIPVLSLALAVLMYYVSRLRGKPRVPLANHFVVALAAMATHPFLDLSNNYGIRLFLPFNQVWSYGDTLFIIDPYLDAILLATIIATYRWRTRTMLAGIAGISLALGYTAVRFELRNIAMRQLEAHLPNVSGLGYAVLPQMLYPWIWTGIVDTEREITNVSIDLFSKTVLLTSGLPKPPLSPAISAAKSTQTGRIFEGFARFPVAMVEEQPEGFRVLLIDYRFYRMSTALAAEIRLDPSLRVESEAMSFTTGIQPPE
jgi:inner membrane protein